MNWLSLNNWTEIDWTQVDWDEWFEYQPGFVVEFKATPGVFDAIAVYDPMMVPPIWLQHDPCPHYPNELRVVLRLAME